ncbi:MAG: hypothetical protein JST36_10375 [Bacteroidetes bacterium]|nr:hypothetical protein [Bacteroidota bacterium]
MPKLGGVAGARGSIDLIVVQLALEQMPARSAAVVPSGQQATECLIPLRAHHLRLLGTARACPVQQPARHHRGHIAKVVCKLVPFQRRKHGLRVGVVGDGRRNRQFFLPRVAAYALAAVYGPFRHLQALGAGVGVAVHGHPFYSAQHVPPWHAP